MHVAPDKGVEGGCGADVDAGQDGDESAADEGRIEWVVHPRVDLGEPPAEGCGAVSRDGPECPACGDVATRAGDDGWNEGDDEEAERSASCTRGLTVDLGEGEIVDAVGDGDDVVDGVEYRDHIQDAGNEADAHLSEDCFWDILAGSAGVNLSPRSWPVYLLWDFLRQMRRAVGVAHTVGSIKHSSDKHKPLAGIPGLVGPSAPDVLVGRILESVDMRHHGAYNDRDEHTGENEEAAHAADERKDPVQKEHNATAQPSADDEAHEAMPRLGDEPGMHERVHRYGLLAQNGRHGGGTQNPRETVPKSGKETPAATIFPCGDGRPVIH